MTSRILSGDCIEVMAGMLAESVDAIVTDPPYGLGFMGKAWDELPPGLPWAQECLRVLKPGGHLLAFGGTRTWHRLAVAVEDAGFEMRDSIAWLYGSGFPKSLDVSKAIDKAAGAEREVVGPDPEAKRRSVNRFVGTMNGGRISEDNRAEVPLTAPATPEAEQWQGWGTALKPAFEPVVVARKPFKGNVAANVLQHGTGALNIDACRIGTDEQIQVAAGTTPGRTIGAVGLSDPYAAGDGRAYRTGGRWPANVVLDESQAAVLDEQSAGTRAAKPSSSGSDQGGGIWGSGSARETQTYLDSGGASRFFFKAETDPFMYCAKAPKKERPVVNGVAHSTVKPLTLMRWLVRLVTPPGGTVLDPFAGSGATVEAALLEGFDVIGIEREADYLPLIEWRIARAALAATEPDTEDHPSLFEEDIA